MERELCFVGRRSEGTEEGVERLGWGEEVCDGGIDGTGEVQE